MSNKKKWCPTQAGSFAGYEPEFFNGAEWVEIQTDRGNNGLTFPRRTGGILNTIDLMGRAQAKAIAWAFAADAESQGEEIEIRIQKYEVVYDIKARKIDAPQEQIDNQ